MLLHPSVALVKSRFPIVTVWESNLGDGDGAMISRWCPEFALVARPFLDVEVWRLSAGGHAFIGALTRLMPRCRRRSSAAMVGRSRLRSSGQLAMLIETNIVVGFRWTLNLMREVEAANGCRSDRAVIAPTLARAACGRALTNRHCPYLTAQAKRALARFQTRWSSEIAPGPRAMMSKRIDSHRMCSGQPEGKTKSWITIVMPNNPSAERREAKPTTSRIGKTCSAMVGEIGGKVGR